MPKYASDDPGENDTPIGVKIFDCPDEAAGGGVEGLKYLTPAATEDMLGNCSKYLSSGQCELLID
jgi:hypothetical protein